MNKLDFFVGESYKFHLRKQKQPENIEIYVIALRQLAKNCNFDQVRDRLIRDKGRCWS